MTHSTAPLSLYLGFTLTTEDGGGSHYELVGRRNYLRFGILTTYCLKRGNIALLSNYTQEMSVH
jgi:hypothetical protein